MSEEKKENTDTPMSLRMLQLSFGIAVVIGSVYGWKGLGIEGFWMFLTGAGGLAICCKALDLQNYFEIW